MVNNTSKFCCKNDVWGIIGKGMYQIINAIVVLCNRKYIFFLCRIWLDLVTTNVRFGYTLKIIKLCDNIDKQIFVHRAIQFQIIRSYYHDMMSTVGGKSLIFLTSNILLLSNLLVGLYPKPIYRFAIKQMQRLSIIPLNGRSKYSLSTMCLMMRTFYLTQRSSIHTTCTYFYILGCIHYVLYDIDLFTRLDFKRFRLIVEKYSPDCTETGCFKAVLIMPHFHSTVKKCISKHRKKQSFE